jgi:hypothetical protein
MIPFFFLAAAEEVAPTLPAIPTAADTPTWVVVLSSLVVALVAWLTKKLRDSVNQKSEGIKIDMSRSLIEQKHVLLERVKETSVRVLANYIENHLFPVMVDALNGGGFDTKKHVQDAFRSTMGEVKQVFAEEGIDLVMLFGKARISGMIQSVISEGIKKIPEQYAKFLPAPLAATLTKVVSDFVVTKTASWFTEAMQGE